ncbi:hypothetical protein Desde_1086 [Desulfitobacterium dehalogenans ATCC 51507]|uniref:Uncharacterized protein n=1 Tax=Desulfitobacterium dehalogenans (strain ATCC 51507 / DSM 9161 / JW/IU-DC1) TaxID=756499 RepID=I4A6D4_DESDJ|nr:hypothetical protein [Desulfitobacterium dehalogenans]AFL99518.1 hypothetical protein Desde_1086 [Desulfitobacterium dehalogenans ATCC 51507]
MINYKRHRRAVERLYEDKCTISRMVDVVKPSGEKRKELQAVYTDQSCKLSQKALASNGQTETANNIAYETKLFIAPEMEIRQGDTIEVTRYGRMLKFIAGEPFVYGSHQEVSMQRKGKA